MSYLNIIKECYFLICLNFLLFWFITGSVGQCSDTLIVSHKLSYTIEHTSDSRNQRGCQSSSKCLGYRSCLLSNFTALQTKLLPGKAHIGSYIHRPISPNSVVIAASGFTKVYKATSYGFEL